VTVKENKIKEIAFNGHQPNGKNDCPAPLFSHERSLTIAAIANINERKEPAIVMNVHW